MTNPAKQWSELASQLEAMALKVKLHFEQTHSEDVPKVLNTLRQTLEDAFAAAGNAIRDEAVREDARNAGKLLGDAVAKTFAKATSEVKDRIDGKK